MDQQHQQPSTPYTKFISLGYRCSSAGILKSLGLKQESLPFDWLVSRLPIIEHCIRTDFREFLNPDNYECIKGATHNYRTLDPSDPASRQWICDESICFNKHYESISQEEIPNLKYYLPRPISPERDAYGYKLMMNHRNIKMSNTDEEYFARCVERFKESFDTNANPKTRRLSLYIHPAIFYEEFLSIRTELIAELRRSHRSIFGTNQDHPHKQHGIYIIAVKTPFDSPTNHCAKYVLEEQPDDESTPGCRICILWANRDFIDAGEIFMGNCHVETYVVMDYLQKTVANRGILLV
jgi:hypothetical protein